MRISQADIGEGIVRILRDRLIVVLDRFAQVRAGPLLGEKFPSEIEFVCFWIYGWCFRDRAFLRPGESCLQRLCDSFRDLTFDSEDVGEFSIVSVSPEVRI